MISEDLKNLRTLMEESVKNGRLNYQAFFTAMGVLEDIEERVRSMEHGVVPFDQRMVSYEGENVEPFPLKARLMDIAR